MSVSFLLRSAAVAFLVALVAMALSALHNSTDAYGTVTWLVSMAAAILTVLLLGAAGVRKLTEPKGDLA